LVTEGAGRQPVDVSQRDLVQRKNSHQDLSAVKDMDRPLLYFPYWRLTGRDGGMASMSLDELLLRRWDVAASKGAAAIAVWGEVSD
jgi:hypothetical protein